VGAFSAFSRFGRKVHDLGDGKYVYSRVPRFVHGSDADIQKWIKQSPGAADAQVSFPKPGVRRFDIQPGGGAQHAEVIVDETKHQVSVYVYWS